MRIVEPYTIFPRTLKSGRVVWYYQYRMADGSRSPMYSLATDKKSVAVRTAKDLYLSGRMSPPEKCLPFSEYTENYFSENSMYFLWKKASGNTITVDTLRAYDKALRNWLLPFFAKIEMKKITPATVKDWLIWTRGKWSQKTAKNAYGVLNIIMCGAVEDRTISVNPCVNISFKKQKKKNRDLLIVEELNFMFKSEWKQGVARDVILLCCVTGMRIGEAIAMRKENVYGNYIDVKLSIPQYGKISDTKTHNPRYVPYPQGFDFTRYEFDGWCFSHDGARVKYHEVYDSFVSVLDAGGIDRKSRGITIHSLRNFFISYMQSENVTESKIRAVVGHADETMTDLYTYWKPEMLPEVYAAQKNCMS